MVHEALDTTGLVLVKALQGDGEIYYQRDGLDVASTPAWAPDGSAIVFQREGAELATLEIASRQLASLSNGVQLSGTPRFLPDGRLVLEGGDAAYILPDAAKKSAD